MTGEAFTQAVQAYGDMVFRVAYHALGSREDAEDVMQTVFLRLFERERDFESQEHMKHWIVRVAVNESRKVLRTFWRRTSIPLEGCPELAAPEDGERAELMRAVMALAPKYRVSVYLYYYEGLSVAQVAAALKADPSTVQTWLVRARARLKKELTEKEEEEGTVYVRPQGIS